MPSERGVAVIGAQCKSARSARLDCGLPFWNRRGVSILFCSVLVVGNIGSLGHGRGDLFGQQD